MRRLHVIHLIYIAYAISSILIGCVERSQDFAPRNSIDTSQIPNAIPKPEPKSLYGNNPSYSVMGHTYHVMPNNKGYSATGIASWYGMKFNKHRTSSGEPYDVFKMTAAHRTLPLPSYVKVTHLKNGRQIIVKVNDRGPFKKDRLIDLSYVAAKKLGITPMGTGLVHIEAIDPKKWQQQTHSTIEPPPQPEKRYILQLGAYKQLANAKKASSRANQIISSPIRIEQKNKPFRAPIYFVRTGPFSNTDKIILFIKQIQAAGLPRPIIVTQPS
jgi:rare lipoprotein A